MNIDLDYIYGMFPLLFTQIILPPLSLINHQVKLSDYPEFIEIVLREIYRILPPKMLTPQYINNLCTDMNNNNQNQWDWTRLSYMFVHADFNHLLGNLKAAYIFGYPLYKECGLFHVYTTFILGGIVAVWPSPLHDKQMTQFVSAFEDTFVQCMPSLLTTYLPHTIQTHIGQLSTYISTKILDYLPRNACGSSGAACSLLGASLIIVMQDFIKNIKNLSYIVDSRNVRSYNNSHNFNNNMNNNIRARTIKGLINNVLFLTTAISYLLHEVHMVSISREDALQISNTYGLLSLRTISNSGHIQGALYGMFSTCIYILNRK